MPSAEPDEHALEPRHLREDELLRLFCHHRDHGDHARAAQMWQQLAVRSYDRVATLVRSFRFASGGRLAPDDRDDATQEAFLRVIAMGSTFREATVGQFRAAVRQCVHNACLDFGRKQLRHERRRAGSLDERVDGSSASPYDATIARFSIEQDALAAEQEADELRTARSVELVAWAITQISNENYRAVLELTYLEGLSGEQIAERLGITNDNVYARRSRGQKQLEAILRDHEA
jgi:RNA polymerase sigma factor (sigma-70 family)